MFRPIALATLTVGTGLTGMYGHSLYTDLKEKYPPIHKEAPKMGSTIEVNGRLKRVISSSGHSRSTCEEIANKIKNRTMEFDLYHAQPDVTGDFAVRNAKKDGSDGGPSILYLAIDAEYPYEGRAPGESIQNTGNIRWFPIDRKVLNRERNLSGKVQPDYEVVHIEDVNTDNLESIWGTVGRALNDLDSYKPKGQIGVVLKDVAESVRDTEYVKTRTASLNRQST